jgi:hypothetical protein
MSHILTFALGALQGGIGLWLGLFAGAGIGLLLGLRSDARLKNRIADEQAINADLRTQLAEAKRTLLFYGRDTAGRTLRTIHNQPWPAESLDDVARAAFETGKDQVR